MQALVDWLFTEAGAGWVFGLVTLVGAAIAWTKRKRPSRIVCKVIARRKLIWEKGQVGERLTVRFGDVEAADPQLLEVEIYNTGSDPIEQVELEIRLPEPTKVIGLAFETHPSEIPLTSKSLEDQCQQIVVLTCARSQYQGL